MARKKADVIQLPKPLVPREHDFEMTQHLMWNERPGLRCRNCGRCFMNPPRDPLWSKCLTTDGRNA